MGQTANQAQMIAAAGANLSTPNRGGQQQHAAFHQQSNFAIGDGGGRNMQTANQAQMATAAGANLSTPNRGGQQQHAALHQQSNFDIGEGFGSRGRSAAAARHGSSQISFG